MNVAVIIPWRDRGKDPLRRANLDRVVKHWHDYLAELHIVDDGGSGDDQFNRSRAYNRGAAATKADVLVYSEADLIVHHAQIDYAVQLAAAQPGLVVPFSMFMAITPEDSEKARSGAIWPDDAAAEQVRGERKSIGAVNVISRESLELVGGYDESFSGAWYDDDAMLRAFEVCCGPTRFVAGPAYHLYHLPGASGDHLTDADREATERNRHRYQLYRQARTPERVRELTAGSA